MNSETSWRSINPFEVMASPITTPSGWSEAEESNGPQHTTEQQLLPGAARQVRRLLTSMALGLLRTEGGMTIDSPETWIAVATVVTAGVAAIALAIGLAQVREARRLRLEQAQPYVVAYMEPSEATPQIVDLVIKNFGSTVAHDVEVKFSPTLKRSASGEGAEDVWLFERLPALVPGQEWRTLWDFAPQRAQTDLPDRYRAVVTYRDSRGRDLPPLASVLDWGAFKGRQYVRVHGMHDAAKSLKDIERTMSRWSEGIRGLSVYTRDGDVHDERKRLEYEEFRDSRRREETLGVEPAEPAPGESPTGSDEER